MRRASCRGRCSHRPGGMHRFYENLRRIRNFPMGRQSRRPLQRPFALPVVADDSVRSPEQTGIMVAFGKFATSSRADVGIGPYKRISNISQYNARNRHSPPKAVPVPYLQIISSLCSRKYGSPPENRNRYVSMCASRSPDSSPDRICARSASHSASSTGCSAVKNVSCIV